MYKHITKPAPGTRYLAIIAITIVLLMPKKASALWPCHLLAEESARQAILKLGEFKKAPIVFRQPRREAELRGHWYCDLKRKAFWIDAKDSVGDVVMGGVFQPAAGGIWKARITFSTRLQKPGGPLGPDQPESPDR